MVDLSASLKLTKLIVEPGQPLLAKLYMLWYTHRRKRLYGESYLALSNVLFDGTSASLGSLTMHSQEEQVFRGDTIRIFFAGSLWPLLWAAVLPLLLLKLYT